MQALFRQTSWGSDCEQTLQLADKYGPGGPFEDPRVVEILNGGSMLPEKGSFGFGGANHNGAGAGSGGGGSGGGGDVLLSKGVPGRSQGSVALLDFLKDVDREYKSRGSGVAVAVKKSPGGSAAAAATVVAGVAGVPSGGNPHPTVASTSTSSSSGNGDNAGGGGPRRTGVVVVTGNPYPPVPAASLNPDSGLTDVGAATGGTTSSSSNALSGFIPPGTTGSPSASTPNRTPTTTSPNLTHHTTHAASPAGVGENAQTAQTVQDQTTTVTELVSASDAGAATAVVVNPSAEDDNAAAGATQ